MESSIARRPDLRLRSCTECRRRKQKCKPSLDPGGPCTNCTKRYPPVVCIKRSGLLTKTGEALLILVCSKLDARLKRNRRPYSVHYQVQVVMNNEQPTYSTSLETPRQFGGTLADVNAANIVPIDPNPQNAELFYFYVQRLSPLMASLDGRNTPSMHHNSILPLLMQSPLLPKIGILEAAGFQEIFRKPDLAETRRMIVLKGEILAHINAFIKGDFNKTYKEAIQSVIHLVILEYYWGDFQSVMAHINGLKDMVRLRGGILALHNPLVTQLIILLDLEIASCYEQNLCIIQPEDTIAIPAAQCPESFENPLYGSGTPFSSVLEIFDIPSAFTTILDDVRLLTSFITCLLTIKPDPEAPSRQHQSTVISDKALVIQRSTLNLPSIVISPSSPASDLIHEIIRITTIIYTTAITSRLPISSAYTPDMRQQVYSTIFRVSLSDWKKIPGIFLWILLVASPGSGKDALGRLLRTNENLAAIYIGLRDFEFAVDCLRTFWGVQRWIVGATGSDEEIVGGKATVTGDETATLSD